MNTLSKRILAVFLTMALTLGTFSGAFAQPAGDAPFSPAESVFIAQANSDPAASKTTELFDGDSCGEYATYKNGVLTLNKSFDGLGQMYSFGTGVTNPDFSTDLKDQALIYSSGDLIIEVRGGDEDYPIEISGRNDESENDWMKNGKYYANSVFGIYVEGNLTIRNAKGSDGYLQLKDDELNAAGNTIAGIHCTKNLKFETRNGGKLNVKVDFRDSTSCNNSYGIYLFPNGNLEVGSGVTLDSRASNISYPYDTGNAARSIGIFCDKYFTMKKGCEVYATGGNVSAPGNKYASSFGVYLSNGQGLTVEDGAVFSASYGTAEGDPAYPEFSSVGSVADYFGPVTETLVTYPLKGLYYMDGEWKHIDDALLQKVPQNFSTWFDNLEISYSNEYYKGQQVDLGVLKDSLYYDVPGEIADDYYIYAMSDSNCTNYSAATSRPALSLDTVITMNDEKVYNLCFMPKSGASLSVNRIHLFADDLPSSFTAGDTIPVKGSEGPAFAVNDFSECVSYASYEGIDVGMVPMGYPGRVKPTVFETDNPYYIQYVVVLKGGFEIDSSKPLEVTMNGEPLFVGEYSHQGPYSQIQLYVYKKYTIGTPATRTFTVTLNGKGTMPDWVKNGIQFESGLRMTDFLTSAQIEELKNLSYTDANGKKYTVRWRRSDNGNFHIFGNDEKRGVITDLNLSAEWLESVPVKGGESFELTVPGAGMEYDTGSPSFMTPSHMKYYPSNLSIRIEGTTTYTGGLYTSKSYEKASIMNKGDVFEAGKTYYVRYSASALSSTTQTYYFDPDDPPEITINGTTVKGYIDPKNTGMCLFDWSFTPGPATVTVTLDLNYPNGAKGSFKMTDVPAGVANNYRNLSIGKALALCQDMNYTQYQAYCDQYDADQTAFLAAHPLNLKCEGYSTNGAALPEKVYYTRTDQYGGFMSAALMQFTADSTLYLDWDEEVKSITVAEPIVPRCGDYTTNNGEPDVTKSAPSTYIDNTLVTDTQMKYAPGFKDQRLPFFTGTVDTSKALYDGNKYYFVAGNTYALHLFVRIDSSCDAYYDTLWHQCLGEGTKLLYAGQEYTGTFVSVEGDVDYIEYVIPVTAEHRCDTVGGITETERKDPTCTEDGYVKEVHKYTCATCNQSVDTGDTPVTKVLSKLGHDWGPWEEKTPATYTSTGLLERTCKNDPKHTEYKTIPKLEKKGGNGGNGGNGGGGKPGVKLTGISVDPFDVKLDIGEGIPLTVFFTPEDAEDTAVTWESSNTGVATVDDAGLVTAVGPGEADITVTSHDGGFKAVCKIVVFKSSRLDDDNNTRISPEDLEAYTIPGKISKTVTSAPVTIGGKEVKASISMNYMSALTYTGGAVKVDNPALSFMLSDEGVIEAAGLKGRDTLGLLTITYKYKNNKNAGNKAYLYPVIKKINSRVMKSLNLSKEEKAGLKKLVKAMNKALKADPCYFTINKASLVDLKDSLEIKGKFGKDGKLKALKTPGASVKSVKAKLDPSGSKLKKLGKKMYEVLTVNVDDGTVKIKGKGNLTGFVTKAADK